MLHCVLGGTNHHSGNKRYRKMVEDRKIDYVNSKRLDKPLVALDIIRVWRNQDPPGRFLKMDEKTKKWNDVGDKKAREKTSQALREKAPLIRQHLEHERRSMDRAERGESVSTIGLNKFLLSHYFRVDFTNLSELLRRTMKKSKKSQRNLQKEQSPTMAVEKVAYLKQYLPETIL